MVDLQSLAVLGLNSYEAAAYVALLGRPELSPAEVASRGNIPRQRVYDVLDSLAAKGLCVARDTTRKVFTAIDPKTAFEVLAQERAAVLERQRIETQAAATRLAAELAPIFATGRSQTDPLAYVEVLSGPARIAHRALALAEAAKKSVNSCVKRPLILSSDQNQTFMKAPLGRGLMYRALFDAEAMEDAELRGWMAQFHKAGMDTRIAPDLPLKMQSFDDEVVLLSMQDPAGGEPSFTAVAIHNRAAVTMLNLAFEHLWNKARPFRG
jgi:HTH-type transcriptional regulator, sugar sensing transcriptional regulator